MFQNVGPAESRPRVTWAVPSAGTCSWRHVQGGSGEKSALPAQEARWGPPHGVSAAPPGPSSQLP